MQHVKFDENPRAFYSHHAELIRTINYHWAEEDRRWRAQSRTDRSLLREATISRLLLAAILLVCLIDTFVG